MSQGKRCKVIISPVPPAKELVVIEEGQPPIEAGFAGVSLGYLWFNPDTDTFSKMVDLETFTWEEIRFSDVSENFNSQTHTIKQLHVKNGIVNKFEIEHI